MFAESNNLSIAVIIGIALLACAGHDDPNAKNKAAITPSAKKSEQQKITLICDVNDNCSVGLDGVAHAIELCDGLSPRLYWNKNKPNTLLACECNCTSHDNKGWLIFANQKQVQGVALGKQVTSESLRGIDKVPDIMANHPFCSKIDHQNLAMADFISLIKYPTGNETSPYCFEPRSILETNGVVRITESGNVLGVDDEATFETSSENKSNILTISRYALDSKSE